MKPERGKHETLNALAAVEDLSFSSVQPVCVTVAYVSTSVKSRGRMLMAVCNHSCGSGHHDQETQARKREDAGTPALLYLCRGAHARAKQLEGEANRGPRGDPLLEPQGAAENESGFFKGI